MGRHAFRMSDKKVKQLRQEEAAVLRAEKKRQAAINAPLFGVKIAAPKTVVKAPLRPTGDTQKRIPSHPNSMRGVATKAPPKVYTGTAMLGVAVMHKSNSVPVFSREDAVAISSMRR